MMASSSATLSSSSSSNNSKAELDHSPSAVDWKQVLELGYSTSSSTSSIDGSTTTTRRNGNVCFHCSSIGSSSNNNNSNSTASADSSKQQQQQQRLLTCSRCHVATYCSKECQIKDWKSKTKGGGGHKQTCASYARVGPNMHITNLTDQIAARNEILARIRYYAFPYAVQKAQTLGRGFLFVQSNHTLATMSLDKPIENSCCFGRVNSIIPTATNRSLLLYYLTVGEYDVEVCRDDFELTLVRTKLRQAVEEYDEETQVVILMRFRCGHMALGTAPLVPEYQVCKSLGKDYYQNVSSGALELHLDDL